MSDKKSTFGGLITDFLEHLEIERGLSPLTIRNYHFWLNRFGDWYSLTYPGKNLSEIDSDIIRKFRVWLARRPGRLSREISTSTQAYHVIALRSFLRWCAKVDLKAMSPDKIDVPKSRSRSLTFLTPDQIQLLLSSVHDSKIKNLRDRAILEVLFSTGLRVSELTSLNRDQVDLIRREFSVIGKGGRSRVVFLSTRAADILKKYLSKRLDHFEPLFVRYGGKKPTPATADSDVRLTSRSVQRLVEKCRRQAGLSAKITPHGLRHSFATDLLRGGADLREVQELLGHKNVSTTQIYTHVTNRQLREVHQRAHSGNK